MRRVFFIVAAFFFIAIIALLVYFFFFRNNAGLTVPNPNDPFAGNTSGNTPIGSTGGDEGTDSGAIGVQIAPRFVKITSGPVALGTSVVFTPGESVISLATSTEESEDEIDIRYVERASGNIYHYKLHEGILTRVTNQTVPAVQEAIWTSDGSKVLMRYLSKSATEENLRTYLMSLGGEGFFLEEGLAQVLVRGTTELFSLLSSQSGSIGTKATIEGTDPKTFFSSPLSSITTAYLGTNILATTKGSARVNGYSFLIDSTGAFTEVLGPLTGLSTLPSPSGKSILYSYNNRGVLTLGVLVVATREVVSLPIRTLSEKCVWSQDETKIFCASPTNLSGTLPDDWYQGAVTFTDRIWEIDMTDRVAALRIDPSEVGAQNIDAVALAVDQTGDVLVFTDRTTGALFSYDL